MLEICLFIFVVTAVYEILKMMWPNFFAKAGSARNEFFAKLLNAFEVNTFADDKKAQKKYLRDDEKTTAEYVCKKTELKVLLSASSLDVDRTNSKKFRKKNKAA